MKKVLGKVWYVVSILMVVWIVASWIDINQHNSPFDKDYLNYGKWNLFEIVENVWD